MKTLTLVRIKSFSVYLLLVIVFNVTFAVNSYAKKPVFSPHAATSVAFIKADEGFQLQGDSCETLYKEIFQFEKLYVKYDKPNAYIKPLCIESIRTIAIQGLIPERMLQLLNQKPQYFGPNCWNSVLYVNKATDHMRFVLLDEFQRTLPFLGCYKKDVKELETGDIVRLSDKNSEEQHAFIYISENLSFTKNGPGTKATYEIVNTESILKEYDVDMKCLTAENRKSEKCLSKVSVYSCDLNTVEDQRNKFADDILNIKISQAEKKLEFVILNYRDPQLNEYKYALLRELLQDSKTLKFIVDKELNQTDVFSYKFFLYKHYQTRLLSISEQISYF